MQQIVLQQGGEIVDELWGVVYTVLDWAPRIVGAALVLLVGWVLGRLAGALVAKLADAVDLDELVLDTPLGRILGGTRDAVSNAFSTITAWFVYALAILAAANVLAIETLSEWIARAVSYLPAFVAGLAIIVVGFVVADFVGDAIMRTRAATETPYTSWFATGTRMFLYFVVIVMGLDTMQVDVGILYVFARAMAWGLAAAVAIGAGIALGWGGKDYVSDNIGRWTDQSAGSVPKPQAKQADGGQSPGDDD